MGLGISDWIALAGILASTIVSIVSVVIAVLTLRQNSKMIHDSTRPYITMYYTTVSGASCRGYFVVKNFGQTGAYITDFHYDNALKNNRLQPETMNRQLDLIKGMYLAPQQKQAIMYYPETLPDHVCRFVIEYTDGKDQYTEICNIDIKNISEVAKYRNATKDKELINISKLMEEYIERLI